MTDKIVRRVLDEFNEVVIRVGREEGLRSNQAFWDIIQGVAQFLAHCSAQFVTGVRRSGLPTDAAEELAEAEERAGRIHNRLWAKLNELMAGEMVRIPTEGMDDVAGDGERMTWH